jgi:glutamine synthetase
MIASMSYTEKIDWQTATKEERKAFYKKMPKDLVEALTEFKEKFDSQVLTIEMIITVEK